MEHILYFHHLAFMQL